jgi:hypothetical protein
MNAFFARVSALIRVFFGLTDPIESRLQPAYAVRAAASNGRRR